MDKLRWVSHKWIEKLSVDNLIERVKPFLFAQCSESKKCDDKKLYLLIEKIKGDLKTLKDVGDLLSFCFKVPEVSVKDLEDKLSEEESKNALSLICEHKNKLSDTDEFLSSLKQDTKKQELKLRNVFGALRFILTGSFNGLGMHDVIEMLGVDEVGKRLDRFC